MKRTKAARLDEPALPTGALIVEGVIPGRAVPWKAPFKNRWGGTIPSRGYDAYKTWQFEVAFHAKPLMKRRKPYGGLVRIDVAFFLCPRGKRTLPDRSNLLKAFEDALQGIVYQNDAQLRCGWTELVVSATEAERVEFRVTAA